jgi:hypothetical protein
MKYKAAFGEPGNPPHTYWAPFLLDVFGLRPWELGRFTHAQMLHMYEYVTKDPEG